MKKKPTLPIHECLSTLLFHLNQSDHVVLQAPPGAGKTTHVPLALLDQPWLDNKKIIMLEPRRIAALNAAKYMAQLLGEKIGETVGYRMRGATKVSAKTRIEVITEGLLTRLLQSDPELNNVAVVIFDEFHERSIHTDTSLALCIQTNELFRATPLKLVVMSATLDGEAISGLLNNAPIVTSQGRCYPVTTHYLDKPVKLHKTKHHSRSANAPLFDDIFLNITVKTIETALKNETGSILVFLPGVREIQHVKNALSPYLNNKIQCFVLHGNLSMADQQKAIAPTLANERKIVLTTDIAQTSITIEGVRIVVDAGLSRNALFSAKTDITRLQTHTISQASAEQREGRAGRTETGSCYRLWTLAEHKQKATQPIPEILTSDLTPLALTLLQWGVNDPNELTWPDAPPNGHWQQALKILQMLGAIDNKSTLTPIGEQLAALPCHPRIARLLIAAKHYNVIELGAAVAALLSEKQPKHASIDIEQTLAKFSKTSLTKNYNTLLTTASKNTQKLAQQFIQILNTDKFNSPDKQTNTAIPYAGILLAFAYPDRIAKLKSRTENHAIYQLANGRAARLTLTDSISQQEWIVAAHLGGFSNQTEDIIYCAASIDKNAFNTLLSSFLKEKIIAKWDKEKNKFTAHSHIYLQQLLISSKPIHPFPADKKQSALNELVKLKGLDLLNINNETQQLIARVNLLHQTLGNPWPDFCEASLLTSLDTWLLPHINNIHTLSDFKKINIKALLLELLPWPLSQEIHMLAPEKIAIPSGRTANIDYIQTPPVLAVKLQEMFGCEKTPTVIQGRIHLSIHLLSPAKRPLQITQDLSAFWDNSYHDVKKEMKGRYPKHPWPDNPKTFKATALTKNKITKP